MDLASLAGIVLAFGLILAGQALEGGHASSILQATAALIVFGGTFGASLVAYPKKDVARAAKMLRLVFADKKAELGGLLQEIVDYSAVARRDGVLALEGRLPGIADPFLRRALQFVVDGVDANVTRSTLDQAIEAEFEENMGGAKVWESAGGFAPTIGILGAVLGLIHVMENLNDPSKLGSGIAVAFVATVYGVGSANILFLPFANKIKRKLSAERDRKILIAEGVLSIQEGLNPRVLEERLRSFIGEVAPAQAAQAPKKAA